MPIILSVVDLPPILPPIRPPLFAEPGERAPCPICGYSGVFESENQAVAHIDLMKTISHTVMEVKQCGKCKMFRVQNKAVARSTKK